jgi:hypothetical protein
VSPNLSSRDHNRHWRNPETGYEECECCCKWALDAAEDKRTIAQLQATVGQVREFLEAIVIAFKEPDGGPYFKLRAFAEKHGIYADDLGRDRVMLRIAQAALATCPAPEAQKEDK